MGKNVSKKGSRQQRTARSGQRRMLGELVRESLYDTVLLSGLAHVIEVLEEERTEVCGPRYRHTEERTAQRGGRVPSSLVLGGRPGTRLRSARSSSDARSTRNGTCWTRCRRASGGRSSAS